MLRPDLVVGERCRIEPLDMKSGFVRTRMVMAWHGAWGDGVVGRPLFRVATTDEVGHRHQEEIAFVEARGHDGG